MAKNEKYNENETKIERIYSTCTIIQIFEKSTEEGNRDTATGVVGYNVSGRDEDMRVIGAELIEDVQKLFKVYGKRE